MRKMMVPLALFTLILWIAGGTWWFSQVWYPRQQFTPAGNVSVALSPISISHSNFNSPVRNVPVAEFSASQILLDASAKDLLDTLAKVLSDSQSSLLLKGVYLGHEAYDGPYENIGMARAAFAKEQLIQRGAAPQAIQLEGRKAPQLLQQDNRLLNVLEFELTEPKALVAEVPATDLISPLNLNFRPGQYQLNMSAPLKKHLENVRELLLEDENTRVYINGYRKRARVVRDFLLRNGFLRDELVLQYASAATASESEASRRVEVRVLNQTDDVE